MPYLFRPTGLTPFQRYRVDTGASNNTAAVIRRVDPQTVIDVSAVRADETGAVTPFTGTAATLYLRPLDYRGVPGTAVSATGSLLPVPDDHTASGSIGLDDLAPDALARMVNDVTGLSMATVPVPPSPPSDGIRVFSQAGKVRFIDATGTAVDVLDGNLAVLRLPDSIATPTPPITGGTLYMSGGYLVSIGPSGTITVLAGA